MIVILIVLVLLIGFILAGIIFNILDAEEEKKEVTIKSFIGYMLLLLLVLIVFFISNFLRG
jgi:protein-S-isoprenylcysteine O-methyltransferase Ste14